MTWRAQIGDSYALTFKLDQAAALLVHEQFEAADMHAAEYRHPDALIQRGDEHRGKVQAEIHLAAGDPLRCVVARCQTHIADVGEALGSEQFLGDVLRGNAEAGKAGKTNDGRLEAVPCGTHGPRLEETGGSRQRKARQKAASRLQHRHRKPPLHRAHTFSSRFN